MKTLTLIILVTFSSCSSIFAQWTLQGTVTGLDDYPSISVYSPTGVVVAGGIIGSNQPKVFKSTNSGLNWTDITGNMTGTPEILCVWAVDGNVIYAGDGGPGSLGGNAKVWKTTNGGATWTNILTTGGSAGYINGIVFSRTTPSFGIIQSDSPMGPGQPFWIAKTTNGGNDWTVTSAPGIANSYGISSSVIAIDNLFYGFGVTPDPIVVDLTTDGGTTWNTRTLGLTGIATFGFAFSSDKTYGIGASNSSLPMISRTTNGGVNWSTLNTGGGVTGICRMTWVYGTSVCFLSSIVGAGGTIMKSTNNGATWVTQSTSGIQGLYNIDLVYISGTVYAYAVARDGSVIRLQDVVYIEPINQNIPINYKLEQNYPNPFNPATKIQFALPKNSFAKLIIYDILGREVATLVNEQLNPGTYEVDWDASNYPNGVYYYKLIAGDYTETKKMVLVK